MSRGLALEAAGRLVDHHPGIGQRKPHVLVPGGEQQRAHRGGLAGAQRRHRRADELHGVVDRKSRCNNPARRVDIHGDFLFGVLRLQEQQLGHDQRRHAVLHRAGDEDDALLEEARIDVVGPLAPVGLLDHHGNEVVHVGVYRVSHVSDLFRRGRTGGTSPPCAAYMRRSPANKSRRAQICALVARSTRCSPRSSHG